MRNAIDGTADVGRHVSGAAVGCLDRLIVHRSNLAGLKRGQQRCEHLCRVVHWLGLLHTAIQACFIHLVMVSPSRQVQTW